MAKQDLINEAQDLGIEVSPEDTVKTIQAKIDEAKSKAGPGPTEATQEKQEASIPVPGGLRRVKVTPAELAKLQAECKLVGYDPVTEEAIIK